MATDLASLTVDPTSQKPLSNAEIQVVQRLLSDPLALPTVFKEWLPKYLETVLDELLPSKRVVQLSKVVTTSENRSSGTYGDLTTPGPVATTLPDGSYNIVFGAAVKVNTDGTGWVGLSIDGAAVSQELSSHVTDWNYPVTGGKVTLTGNPAGGHSLKLQYKYTGAAFSADFQNRFLLVFQTDN